MHLVIFHVIKHITSDERTLWNTVSNKVDKVSGKGLSTNDYTVAEKTKLAGIAENANNYAHPSTHDASMITELSTKRFVSDTEKATWNGKASTAVASTSVNGLMSSADKTKLDGIASGANKYVHPNDANTRHVTDAEKTTWNGKASTAVASTSVNGLMSSADKTKLDGIASGANKYVHPNDANTRHVTDAEKTTWNGKASTAVASTSVNGLMSSADKTKLDGIASGANKYVHPNDANTRHVTDTEKTTWNSKANASHKHKKADITDFPSSLPANGGNSDTVDGLHASGFTRVHSGSVSFGGNNKEITTAEFKTLLTTMGAFKQPHWIARGSWSYATNQIITDSGFGKIHLAGCVVEVIGTSSAYTIRISTPTTASGGSSSTLNCEFMYVDNGTSYSPRWSKIWTSNNDGGGSGMDADTVDGKHASDFLPKKGLTWNDLKGM